MVDVPLIHPHTNTCESPSTCAHHMHVWGGVVKHGTLVQVAMTDLEDVVDVGWPMEDMCDM